MKSVATFFLLTTFLAACSQTKQAQIVKTHGYFQTVVPGIIPRDEVGNRQRSLPDTLYSVFVELKGEAPQWTGAWVGEKAFRVQPFPVRDSLVYIGKRKGSSESEQLQAAPGYHFSVLRLVKESNASLPPKKMESGTVLLQGKFKTKTFYQVVPLTELTAPLRQ